RGPAAAQPAAAPAEEHSHGPDGTVAVAAPMQGMIVAIKVEVGATVSKGQPVAVLEALKMEHLVVAQVAGTVREIALEVGDTIFEDTPVLFIEPGEVDSVYTEATVIDLDRLRPDVAEIVRFHQLTTDEARTESTAKRHNAG